MLLRRTVLAAALALAGAAAGAADAGRAPQTAAEKMGYAIGVELAGKFHREHFELDVEMAAQGLRDAMAGQVKLGPEELAFVLKSFQTEMRRKVAQNRVQAAQANRERNDRFFAANRAEPGVRLLPSGVQVRVLREGSGPKPTDANAVRVAYRGSLLDGSEFEHASAEQPARLKLAHLVPGWRIALSAMPVGSRWQVWIPAPLAYGERGSAGVGPHEPLVLDLELLAIDPA